MYPQRERIISGMDTTPAVNWQVQLARRVGPAAVPGREPPSTPATAPQSAATSSADTVPEQRRRRAEHPVRCGIDGHKHDVSQRTERRFARACPLADSHGPLTVAPPGHGGRWPGQDRPGRRSSQRRGHRPQPDRAHAAVPPDPQMARPVTARPARKRAPARWLTGPVAGNGGTRLDRRPGLVTHQCALRQRDRYVYRRLTGLSRSRTSAAPGPRETPRGPRPQDQIPERARPRGRRTGVTAFSPQPRRSP